IRKLSSLSYVDDRLERYLRACLPQRARIGLNRPHSDMPVSCGSIRRNPFRACWPRWPVAWRSGKTPSRILWDQRLLPPRRLSGDLRFLARLVSRLDLIDAASRGIFRKIGEFAVAIAAPAQVSFWQILLQKSLMVWGNADSVAVMRFAVEASDDGTA